MLEIRDKSSAELVKLDDGNSLNIDLSKFNRCYGVNLSIKQENKEMLKLSFEYGITSRIAHNGAILTIDRNNLLINESKPSSALDELAHKCGQAIYPLELLVNQNLKPVKIINHKDIVKRWVDVRNKILKESNELNGIAKNYIHETQKNLMNSSFLFNSIKRNIFLSSLFKPLHTNYSLIYNDTELDVDVSVLPHYRPLKYKVKQKVVKHYTKFNTITITQDGTLNDDMSAYDLSTRSAIKTNAGEKAKGKLKTSYQLDKESKVINSVITNYNIELPYGESREIELTAFHIAEKQHLIKEK